MSYKANVKKIVKIQALYRGIKARRMYEIISMTSKVGLIIHYKLCRLKLSISLRTNQRRHYKANYSIRETRRRIIKLISTLQGQFTKESGCKTSVTAAES
jgi:hypothetical protein